jgi:hypothetical protein
MVYTIIDQDSRGILKGEDTPWLNRLDNMIDILDMVSLILLQMYSLQLLCGHINKVITTE